MNASRVGHAYLHGEYCDRTHLKIPFTDELSTAWWQWLAWRSPLAFTATDLRLVIAWLRREIRAGRRHPTCLEFFNLVGNPELFEQYLGLAQRWSRMRRVRAAGLTRARLSNGRAHG